MNSDDLTKREQKLQDKLMKTKMSEWPEGLYNFCKAQSRIYGYSGDAIADWIEIWIKRQREPRP
jgi:hypothetical protein